MTPERISELRKQIAYLGDSVEKEMLDALEAAQAELAALRGGKVGSVYYPGICEDDIDEMWRTCESCADPARAMAVEGYKLAMDHLPAGTEILDHAVTSVPEGKVLVDAVELADLKECAYHVLAISDPRPNVIGEYHRDKAMKIAKRVQRPGQGGKGGDG